MLGWFYETETIKGRIAQFRGGIVYVPRAKIRERVVKSQNKFVQDAIDRGNMKVASIAKNIIAQYGVSPSGTQRTAARPQA